MNAKIPLFRFSKPKGPGFGLSKQFYLTVLAGKSVLPPIKELVRPGGAPAIEGFGVPLVAKTDTTLLDQPMERGHYAIATKDQTTVLKMTVLHRTETAFDPEALAQSALSMGLSQEALARIRATWSLCQLTFESHNPEVYPALDFMLSIAQRMAFLTDGVIADPISMRYLLPDQVFANPRLDPRFDAREIVSIHHLDRGGSLSVFTRGLQKIAQSELNMDLVPEPLLGKAGQYLMLQAQAILAGKLVQNGDRAIAPGGHFDVRVGGFDRATWDGIPVFDLIPPTKVSVEALINL